MAPGGACSSLPAEGGRADWRQSVVDDAPREYVSSDRRCAAPPLFARAGVEELTLGAGVGGVFGCARCGRRTSREAWRGEHEIEFCSSRVSDPG